jgi:hypothetical protein
MELSGCQDCGWPAWTNVQLLLGGCHDFGASSGNDNPYDAEIHFHVHLPNNSAIASHRAEYTTYEFTDRMHEISSEDETGDKRTGIHQLRAQALEGIAVQSGTRPV